MINSPNDKLFICAYYDGVEWFYFDPTTDLEVNYPDNIILERHLKRKSGLNDFIYALFMSNNTSQPIALFYSGVKYTKS